MIELGLQGSRRYWFWIFGLFAIIAVGGVFYYNQLKCGLMVTGQSRDVSWGFYTAQMTFFVGVAAGGVMLILPYYLHDYKKFGRITILGEFLAAASIIMPVICCGTSGPANADPFASHTGFHALLGRKRAIRLSCPEHYYREEGSGSRVQRHGSACLDQTFDLHFHYNSDEGIQ